MEKVKKFLQKPWLYICIVLIGVSFKFYRLDYKFFWFDEVTTIAHTSGNVGFSVPVNEIKNISYYRNQLHLNERDFTIGEQYQRLSKMVNLNPLHYCFLILWHRFAGDSPICYRLFSVFIFLLTLPLLYKLIKILFQSKLAGWIAISLFSVSPFFQVCSQQARYIMLWGFTLILLHYLILIAVEKNSIQWWIAYVIVSILALYASVLSGLVIIGHALYVCLSRKEHLIKMGISGIVILLGYLPWILLMINNRDQIVESLAWTTSYGDPKIWQILLAHVYYLKSIFQYLSDSDILYMLINGLITLECWKQILLDVIITFLIILAIIHLFRKARREVVYFLLLTYLTSAIFISISDVVRGGYISFFLRYNMIQIISVLLIMVYFIYRKISESKLFFSGIYLGLVVIGIASMVFFSKKRCLLNTSIMCRTEIYEAQLFSNSQHPLVVTDFNFPFNLGIGNFMTIINECESDSIDILYASPDIDNMEGMLSEKNYSEIFVVHASDPLVDNLKSQFEERMDSLQYEEPYAIWQINLNENNFID